MAELKVESVGVRLGGNEILKAASLTLGRGEVVALLGPSGSGKTTLLRCVAGLETPHAGRITLGEKVLFDAEAGVNLPVEGRGLGLVFQSYALWPHRTVFENVAYGLKLRKTPAGETATRVSSVLAQLGLKGLERRHPHELSGGQQQRVALARALVYNPPVLLLDEPLSNLDARLREEARAWLRELIIELQLSALCVTHDQADAMAIADRIVLLSEGRVAQDGTPVEVYGSPSSLFAAEFMGSNNRLAGRVVERRDGIARVEGDGFSLWGLARGDVREGAAATGSIRVERTRIASGPGDNRIPAPLTASRCLGDHWEHLFHVGDSRLRVFGSGALPAGDRWLELPVDDFWVFPSAP